MSDEERKQVVRDLLARPYRKLIRGTPEEGFLAEVPELPGCITAGETEAEALDNLKEAMEGWLLVALERGIPIPEPAPQPERQYSGRMLVRMPRTLHRKLAQRAEQEGVSTNQLAVTLLAEALGQASAAR